MGSLIWSERSAQLYGIVQVGHIYSIRMSSSQEIFFTAMLGSGARGMEERGCHEQCAIEAQWQKLYERVRRESVWWEMGVGGL